MGDSIRANFGQEPFKYDIEDHVQGQRDATWNKILGTPIDRSILQGHQAPGTDGTGEQSPLSDDESKQVLNELIMSYLVHHGHVKTARAFKHQRERRDTKGLDSSKGDGCDDVYMSNGSKKADVAETDIALRTSIVNDVLAGNIDKAIDSLHDHYPTVLEADKQLIFFKLRFRKFVELILVTTELKKKMKAMKELETQHRKLESKVEPSHDSWMVEDIMDVDEDASPFNAESMLLTDSHSSCDKHPDPELNEINSQYEAALNIAILYGQTLSNDFHSDSRPDLQQLFRKTFGIVAWEDPLEEGSGMADIVGNESRITLALEINQAILSKQKSTIFKHVLKYPCSRVPRLPRTSAARNPLPSYSDLHNPAWRAWSWLSGVCRYATRFPPVIRSVPWFLDCFPPSFYLYIYHHVYVVVTVVVTVRPAQSKIINRQ